MEKRGQMKLSFGMIFSIILIIIFITFAVYGISIFLNMQKNIQIESFASNLQSDVDNLWGGSYGSVPQEYILPKKIFQVCFKEPARGDENMKLMEEGKLLGQGYEIKHLNPIADQGFCVENKDGRVKIMLKKDLRDVLVTITEVAENQ